MCLMNDRKQRTFRGFRHETPRVSLGLLPCPEGLLVEMWHAELQVKDPGLPSDRHCSC